MPVVISNASPLIGLTGIDLLHILRELWGNIIIPEAVYGEVVIKGSGKPGASIIADACKDWIEVVTVKNRQEVRALQTVLDEGEAEVIALGQEINGAFSCLIRRSHAFLLKQSILKSLVLLVSSNWHGRKD